MKNLMLAAGFFAAAFTIIAACRWRKRPKIRTFRELYEDNDVSLEGLLYD